MRKRVEDLVEGDVVDLEGDAYAAGADPAGTLEFEGVEVARAERETPACVRVDFEGFDSVGFPTGHEVELL